ncbi:MAG: ankyrin repeat domain-containing protein [Shewanella sp.]|nr:ankyrin repeat domain-containing protein [Shewanella sp.]
MRGIQIKLRSYYDDVLKDAIARDDASAITNLLISCENDQQMGYSSGISTLFGLCLEGKKISAAKALVDFTANPPRKKQLDDRQECVDKLLGAATLSENSELVSYLLAANANPMYGDSGKESGTLTLSSLKTEPDIFYELLTHVELKNLSLTKFSKILIRFLISNFDDRTAKLIEKVGSQYFLDLNESGHPMLIHLMHEKLFGQIEKLIGIGKDLNIDVGLEQKDATGFTPLMHAVMFQREKTVNLLIDTKVKVDALSTDGKSALHLASSRDSKAILQALIDAGGDVT